MFLSSNHEDAKIILRTDLICKAIDASICLETLIAGGLYAVFAGWTYCVSECDLQTPFAMK